MELFCSMPYFADSTDTIATGDHQNAVPEQHEPARHHPDGSDFRQYSILSADYSSAVTLRLLKSTADFWTLNSTEFYLHNFMDIKQLCN